MRISNVVHKTPDISSLKNIIISDFCYFFVTAMLPGFPCSDRDSVMVSPRVSYFNRILYHSGELVEASHLGGNADRDHHLSLESSRSLLGVGCWHRYQNDRVELYFQLVCFVFTFGKVWFVVFSKNSLSSTPKNNFHHLTFRSADGGLVWNLRNLQ